MRSISWSLKRQRPNDAIKQDASPTPHRPPSWPRPAAEDGTWWNLPPENPNLFSAADPAPAEQYGARHRRPSCLILGASRTEHERQRRTAALADALGFEAAVADATLILHPDDVGAAAYLDLLHAALPVVSDRRTLPLALTR